MVVSKQQKILSRNITRQQSKLQQTENLRCLGFTVTIKAKLKIRHRNEKANRDIKRSDNKMLIVFENKKLGVLNKSSRETIHPLEKVGQLDGAENY